jgi:hypothetical protein
MQTDPNSKYILDKLSEINLNTTYRVDQKFVTERDTVKIYQYGDNNGKQRTEKEKQMDIDCEFVDEMVKQSGRDFILESENIKKYDFRFRKDPENVIWCMDNKVVHQDKFYLHPEKYMQYLKSFNQGKLHYFAFWRFMERPTEPLKVGDQPQFLLLNVISAGMLLHKMVNPKKMTKPKNGGEPKYIIEVI